MPRQTGTYRTTTTTGESVQAFVPHPLPPADPPLSVSGGIDQQCTKALAALAQLEVAGNMVPSTDWFLYGFVRKEAVLTSQIEGTQATLRDVLAFEATDQAERPEDVEEVCNYVDALTYARRELAKSKGLPLSTRLLCEAHKRLMKGVRGSDKQPGTVRKSQNWVGGTRPGNARFVPPPPEDVPAALTALERWIHGDDPLPPLIKAGLAHVQFETIHPFLDGNGRIGRLLITLLLEHWGILKSPLLYLSLAFKRHQREYYDRLSAVRTDGDWEGWTDFYLSCVHESGQNGIDVAQQLFTVLGKDRRHLTGHARATVAAIQLLDMLPEHPMVTVPRASELLKTTAPTARKAIDILAELGVLRETTGKQRDRVFAYHKYLQILTGDEA
jgi:Fic family protein